MYTRGSRALGVGLAIGMASACGGNTGGDGGASGHAGFGGVGAVGGTGASSGTGGTKGGGPDGGTGGIVLTGGAGGSGGAVSDAGCASTSFTAESLPREADVVFAIDTSESMTTAMQGVADGINAFATRVREGGIDLNVVLLAARSQLPPYRGICVARPLGSGACLPGGDDTNLPRFLHPASAVVGAHDSLNVLVSAFGEYRSSLRQFSRKTLVVVSNDDATAPPHDTSERFGAAYSTLEPSLTRSFRFSGVYAFSQCPEAAAVGNVYAALVDSVGGVGVDLCEKDVPSALLDIADDIVENILPCTLALPSFLAGFDPDHVNLELTSGGSRDYIYRVRDSADCDPASGGWYYDDPVAPKAIHLCPATCTAFRTDPNSSLSLIVACGGPPLPP